MSTFKRAISTPDSLASFLARGDAKTLSDEDDGADEAATGVAIGADADTDTGAAAGTGTGAAAVTA